MIRELHLENYRSFENYALKDLARVNLLVGGNDCGKTSILEAVRLLAGRGDIRIVGEIVRARGEVESVVKDPVWDSDPAAAASVFPTVKGLFRGHRLDFQSKFSIQSGEFGRLDAVIGGAPDDPALRSPALETPWALRLAFERARPIYWELPVGFGGAFDPKIAAEVIRRSGWPKSSAFVPLRPLLDRELLGAWDVIQHRNRIAAAVSGLRILIPGLEDVYYVASEGSFFLRLSGRRDGVPLGSFGGGARQLFSILVEMLAAPEKPRRILLVDEIESGIHYSLQTDLWRMLVETARDEDIQVFATTHSKDCLEALAEVCIERPDLASEASVHKLDRRLAESVSLPGVDLHRVLAGGIEVR